MSVRVAMMGLSSQHDILGVPSSLASGVPASAARACASSCLHRVKVSRWACSDGLSCTFLSASVSTTADSATLLSVSSSDTSTRIA
eukprot:1911315-Pleurochrysis_carterae.AAC.1